MIYYFQVINLKILFKNTTTYSKETYDKFLEFHRKKFGLKYKLFNIFIIFVMLACIIFLVGYHYIHSAIFFCCFLVGFVFWRYLKPISDVSKEYKSDKIANSSSFTFIFYEKNFTVKDKKYISQIKYRNLYKIFDVDDFFYLYLDKTHSFLLQKDCFSKGDYNEFYSFIKKKISFL